METKEFIIVSKSNPKQFLQHVSFTHIWGKRDDAMIYTSADVAGALAVLHSGIVIPANANLPK